MEKFSKIDKLKIDIFNLIYKVRKDNLIENRAYKFEIDDCVWAYISDNDAQYDNSVGVLAQIMAIIFLESNDRKADTQFFRQNMKDLLKEESIEEIFSDFSDSEISQIRYDLEILGFILPDITKTQYG